MKVENYQLESQVASTGCTWNRLPIVLNTRSSRSSDT